MAYVYAVCRPYGIHTRNTDGNRSNVLRAFTSRTERDAWVQADTQHRESIPASHFAARRFMRGGIEELTPYGGMMRFMDR